MLNLQGNLLLNFERGKDKSMSARFTSTYNTQDELDFLKDIGNFRVVGKKKYTRRQLLEFYQETMEKRVNCIYKGNRYN